MELGKLNVTVSKESADIIKKYQEDEGYSNLDSAVDSFILEKAKLTGK